LFVCGGVRDVAKNESKEGLRKISEPAGFLNNTNVIVTCIPHSYDLQADSCVNKEVESFNRKLQKQMKAFKHVKICNISDNRQHFTSHGFRMNPKGKSDIVNKLASCIEGKLVEITHCQSLPFLGQKQKIVALESLQNVRI
jgi:hypothetical protein